MKAKILELLITSCNDCPYRSGKHGDYKCGKVHVHLQETTTLPEWCPLPDTADQIVLKLKETVEELKKELKKSGKSTKHVEIY